MAPAYGREPCFRRPAETMRTPSASPKTFRAAVDAQTLGFTGRPDRRNAEANDQPFAYGSCEVSGVRTRIVLSIGLALVQAVQSVVRIFGFVLRVYSVFRTLLDAPRA